MKQLSTALFGAFAAWCLWRVFGLWWLWGDMTGPEYLRDRLTTGLLHLTMISLGAAVMTVGWWKNYDP
jgi:hypothetical protein